MVALKVSALASGVVLLDGKPIELDGLEQALKEAKQKKAVVWYYEEPPLAARAPSPAPVMSLILKYALPVSLATTPDFANRAAIQVTGQVAGAEPPPDIESIFNTVRRTAAGRGLTCLVIIRPDHQLLILPTPQNSTGPATRAANLGGLIPPESKRAIAVIADTRFTMGSPGTNATIPSLQTAARAIPFLGLLMALSHAGHAVWIFDGNAPDFAAGCRDADLLIVDGSILPQLRQDWSKEAASVMRNPNILVHDPRSYQLRIVRKAGEGSHALEFPN